MSSASKIARPAHFQHSQPNLNLLRGRYGASTKHFTPFTFTRTYRNTPVKAPVASSDKHIPVDSDALSEVHNALHELRGSIAEMKRELYDTKDIKALSELRGKINRMDLELLEIKNSFHNFETDLSKTASSSWNYNIFPDIFPFNVMIYVALMIAVSGWGLSIFTDRELVEYKREISRRLKKLEDIVEAGRDASFS